ncbi:AI-2E family transporter [Brevibacterium sp. BRM-1]|uniref:AI-2E family transporter n=1 Tax=Brevibacterium sp. BRM-1 TaxID=2999062 RepID=UPI00227F4447|nr:AI-2E family transporter [Brevibacterium sp. BRM-1]WAL39215.1 AI-2E family transporter [Brevibacterium sp. BRM-1]
MSKLPGSRRGTLGGVVPPPPARRLQVPAFWMAFVGTLGVGLGLMVINGLSTIASVITYVGVALFLALGLDPVIQFLEKRHIRRGLATVLTLVVMVLAVTGVFLLIVPPVVAQIQAFIGNLPVLINELANREWVKDLEAQFAGSLDLNALVSQGSQWASDPKNILSLGGGVVAVGAGIANFTAGLIIVVILTIYFTATLPSIKRGLYLLVPRSRRAFTESVTEEVTRSVGRYVFGQVLLAAINGLLSSIFLTIIGSPLPALLAFIAFLGSLIPLVGTLSGSIVIVASCLFVSPSMAIIAGIYYLIYMQIEAYILSPRIMNQAVNVPGSIVIIAAAAGGGLGGVLGAIVAVPLAASLLIIVRRVVIPHQHKR